jgi:precorrin-2/cobalt-factor-2 C20-methyltransferase
VLSEGDETLVMIPVLGDAAAVAAGMVHADTAVFYKCGRHLDLVTEAVRSHDRLGGAVFGAQLGLPGEQIRPLGQVDTTAAPYLSTVIVPARRTTKGGRL